MTFEWKLKPIFFRNCLRYYLVERHIRANIHTQNVREKERKKKKQVKSTRSQCDSREHKKWRYISVSYVFVFTCSPDYNLQYWMKWNKIKYINIWKNDKTKNKTPQKNQCNLKRIAWKTVWHIQKEDREKDKQINNRTDFPRIFFSTSSSSFSGL